MSMQVLQKILSRAVALATFAIALIFLHDLYQVHFVHDPENGKRLYPFGTENGYAYLNPWIYTFAFGLSDVMLLVSAFFGARVQWRPQVVMLAVALIWLAFAQTDLCYQICPRFGL